MSTIRLIYSSEPKVQATDQHPNLSPCAGGCLNELDYLRIKSLEFGENKWNRVDAIACRADDGSVWIEDVDHAVVVRRNAKALTWADVGECHGL